jgi:hypothetical protein
MSPHRVQSVLGGLLWLLAASLGTGNSLAFAREVAGPLHVSVASQ